MTNSEAIAPYPPCQRLADVYATLEDHQQAQDPAAWTEMTFVAEMHRWRDIFEYEFKLDLPPVVFAVRNTRSNCYGYYRRGHNDLGIAREIAITRRHLKSREHWQSLGTLLHECLHACKIGTGSGGGITSTTSSSGRGRRPSG